MLSTPEFKPTQRVYTETKDGNKQYHEVKRRAFNRIWNEWTYETTEGKQYRECYLFKTN